MTCSNWSWVIASVSSVLSVASNCLCSPLTFSLGSGIVISMRSWPWRTMEISYSPSGSTRRRSTWIVLSMTSLAFSPGATCTE
jgi:hypothetical protein